MTGNPYSCILISIEEDYKRARNNLKHIYDMLLPKSIIVMGPVSLAPLVAEDSAVTGLGDRLSFIDERELLSFDDVKAAYDNRIAVASKEYNWQEPHIRAGWYYQQFLKMFYHTICPDEYYLCWDVDTLPLRPVNMLYSDGKPIFDVKKEYITNYFEAIEALFGFGRAIEQSFISEHMLFNKKLMAEMINEIEGLPLPGKAFYEKIFSVVKYPKMGFAEFETYGCWVAHKYPGLYYIRDWKSLRNTNFLIDRPMLTKEDISYLATGFDAASFERYQKPDPYLTDLFRDEHYREKLPADLFYKCLLEEGIFGEYKDGALVVNDHLWPT